MHKSEQTSTTDNVLSQVPFLERITHPVRSRGIMPRVEVDVYHGGHYTARDLRGSKRFLEGADIYMPELAGWTNHDKTLMNMLSRGALSPDQVGSENETAHEFKRAERRSIHGSGISVTYLDLPRGRQHREMVDLSENSSIGGVARSVLIDPSIRDLTFGGVIDLARQRIIEHAEAVRRREDHMIKKFDPEVRKVLAENPKLKEKETVQVRMRIGAAHTRVSHGLRERGHIVKRSFQSMPTFYHHEDEAMRAVLFGKELDDTLVARSLLTGILSYVIHGYNYGKEDNKFDVMNRKIVSAFSYEDIQSMVDNYWQNGQIEEFKSFFTQEIQRTKGIRIPTTVTEMNSFLGTEAKKPHNSRKKRKRS